MEDTDWAELPDHILVEIMNYLTRGQRYKASMVCKSWQTTFESPYLWRHMEFKFHVPEHARLLNAIPRYGRHISSVYIELDQAHTCNRDAGSSVIERLASIVPRRLQRIKVKFTGENPLFYAGKEFADALLMLFCRPSGDAANNVAEYTGLIDVDISQMFVAIDDALLNKLSEFNTNIVDLNIQNRNLICRVSPTCILRLLVRCRKLKRLHVYNSSMSEDVLVALTEPDRTPLQHLSIIYRREEKFLKDISDDAWAAVVKQLPRLRVTLAFDHTIGLNKVKHILKPPIPVSVLRFDTFTRLYEEINTAASFYKKTLEKLVVQSTGSPELNEAILNVVKCCPKLSSLHVFCVLEKEIVDEIFVLRPLMKEKGTYTLKYIKEPHPWVAGNDW